jgi:hypothetical protein
MYEFTSLDRAALAPPKTCQVSGSPSTPFCKVHLDDLLMCIQCRNGELAYSFLPTAVFPLSH